MARSEAGLGGLRRLSFAEAVKVDRSAARLTSGSATLDRLLGGGFTEGKLVEVVGASNSGKTQLGIQAAVMAAARGWTSVYVDTESTFRPERVEQMAEPRGIDAKKALESIYSFRASDVDEQGEVLLRMAEDTRVSTAKLVVVDTVTKNFALEYPGRERTAKRQGALGAYLNRIAIDAYLNRRVVVLTNRVASVSREGLSQDVGLGGLTLQKYLDKSVHLVRKERGSVYASLALPKTTPQVECKLTERGLE